jgi:hypothetical protein
VSAANKNIPKFPKQPLATTHRKQVQASSFMNGRARHVNVFCIYYDKPAPEVDASFIAPLQPLLPLVTARHPSDQSVSSRGQQFEYRRLFAAFLACDGAAAGTFKRTFTERAAISELSFFLSSTFLRLFHSFSSFPFFFLFL